ncbi:MAG: ASCH domain-containing protein [Anaerolineae bacterium]|nr:ASCH domain-containing protein [Anaerolineae bacterium]
MQFQRTLDLVVNGQKTQTRRPAKPSEVPVKDASGIKAIQQANRVKWQVGRTYAIQPKRGARQVGRFRITSIRYEVVANISESDAKSEGFGSQSEFLKVWESLHGKSSENQVAWVIEFEVVTLNDRSNSHS